LKTTFQALKDRLNTHGGGGSQGALTAAFRRMDANRSGTVRGEEIKRFLISTQRGMEDVNMKVIDAIVDLCDRDGDGEVDYSELSRMVLCDDIIELLSLVPDKTVKHAGQAYKNQVVGKQGVTVAELQKAQQLIKERLNTKYKNVAAALRAADTKGDGILSRQEVLALLNTNGLLRRVDYHTGATIGELTMAVVDTLMDFVDRDGDGKVNYQEFTRVLVAEDIMQLPQPPKASHVQVRPRGR
jgi:Ca2+-binding EF-hand superfamily protein